MEKKEETPFFWYCQQKAEALILKALESCIEKNELLQKLSIDLAEKTSTRLYDWVDHIEIGYSDSFNRELQEAGFVSELATPLYRIFNHPGAKLPLVVVKDHTHPFVGVSLVVESIADFLMCQGISSWIE